MTIKKKALVYGNFNVLHPGHLRLFRFAKENSDWLIVAVNSDVTSGDATDVNEVTRCDAVKNSNWVDEAFINRLPLTDLILKFKPTIIVKGHEHKFKDNPELSAIEEVGSTLLFYSDYARAHVTSQFDGGKQENASSINIPQDYFSRHAIELRKIHKTIRRFSDLNVCVIGDTIVDEYIDCDTIGLSREEPTIVVSPVNTERFVGGAGIVALHCAAMGAKTQFISALGEDEAGEFAIANLNFPNLNLFLDVDKDRKTVLKQRYRGDQRSLLRVNHFPKSGINKPTQELFLNCFCQSLPELDLLIFADFNYGGLPQELVDKMTSLCKENGVLVTGDSQSSSQIGNIARFRGSDLITPTEHEARLSLLNNDDGLVTVSRKLIQRVDTKFVIITLGADGVLISHQGSDETQFFTDRLKALNTQPRDVSGAGDSMLVGASLSLASGLSIWEASFIGSAMAAIQVGRVGNKPIFVDELQRVLI